MKENCTEYFEDEDWKYMECLCKKIPKYRYASEIASYLTLYVLQVDDPRIPSSNWDIYMLIGDPENKFLTQNEIEMILITYKEIFRDLLKRDEEELHKIIYGESS